MTPTELGWLAGLIEGEGCVVVTKHALRLSIEMTDLDVLQKAASLIGPTCRLSKRTVKLLNPKHKDRYILHLCGPRLPEILQMIYPLMGQRRKAKIDEALAKWKTRKRKMFIARPRAAFSYSFEHEGIR